MSENSDRDRLELSLNRPTRPLVLAARCWLIIQSVCALLYLLWAGPSGPVAESLLYASFILGFPLSLVLAFIYSGLGWSEVVAAGTEGAALGWAVVGVVSTAYYFLAAAVAFRRR